MGGAVLVVGAMFFASPAHAYLNRMTTGVRPNTHIETGMVEGRQIGTAREDFLGAGRRRATCVNSTVSYTSTINAGASTEPAFIPSYELCAMAGLPTTIDTNDCGFVFSLPKTVGGEKYRGRATLSCLRGEGIEVSVFLGGSLADPTGYETRVCKLTISPGGNASKATGRLVYKNRRGVEVSDGIQRGAVVAAATIDRLHYRMSGLCGAKSGSGGAIDGRMTLTARGEDGAPIDIWICDFRELEENLKQ